MEADNRQKSERALQLDAMLASGETDVEMLAGIAADYPYFLLPHVLLLQSGQLMEKERHDTLSLAAAVAPDRNRLESLVGESGDEFADFYPPEQRRGRASSTMDTINHFLNVFGRNDETELHALEQCIFNPVPDYAQMLAREEEEQSREETAQSENDALINKFIARSKEQSGHFLVSDDESEPQVALEVAAAPAPKKAEDSSSTMLSESLAKIYIKQRRYEKALEIIQSLSLNFPEKSIYFADQMRFLRKLIQNEKYKQKNNK